MNSGSIEAPPEYKRESGANVLRRKEIQGLLH
jgi:hypothetical protein